MTDEDLDALPTKIHVGNYGVLIPGTDFSSFAPYYRADLPTWRSRLIEVRRRLAAAWRVLRWKKN